MAKSYKRKRLNQKVRPKRAKKNDAHIKNIAQGVVRRNIETKYFTLNMTAPTSFTGPGATFPLMYQLTTGTLQNQRISDLITLTGVSIKGFVRVQGVKSLSANVYIALFWTDQKNAVSYAYGDYFRNTSAGFLVDKPDLDKVTPVYTKRLSFKADSTVSDQILKFNFYRRFNRKVRFQTESTNNWCKGNQLQFVVFTDDADVRMNSLARVYFKDA